MGMQTANYESQEEADHFEGHDETDFSPEGAKSIPQPTTMEERFFEAATRGDFSLNGITTGVNFDKILVFIKQVEADSLLIGRKQMMDYFLKYARKNKDEDGVLDISITKQFVDSLEYPYDPKN